MTVKGSTNRIVRMGATALLALPLAAAPALVIAVGAVPAAAETEEEALAKKAEWQERYRVLRNNVARMQENAKKLRRAYGLAQHANYPRGGAREALREQAEKAEQDAEDFTAQIAELHEEARRNEIPPGWLAEVEDEPIDHGLPADQDESAPEGEEDREGRNPLYFEVEQADDERDEDL